MPSRAFSDDLTAPLLALLAIIALGVGAIVALRVRRWLDRRRRRRKAAIAQGGERGARRWLETNGFTVRGEQSTLHARMMVDGVIREFDVCADYIVERNGRRGIVEVKTGDAAHPTARSTRRQIFEYAALFDADVYVFDANRQRLHEVTFESVGTKRPFVSPWRWWWWGFATATTVAVAVFSLLRA